MTHKTPTQGNKTKATNTGHFEIPRKVLGSQVGLSLSLVVKFHDTASARLLLLVLRQISLCSPHCPGTLFKVGLELTEVRLSPASQMLGSKVCTTTSWHSKKLDPRFSLLSVGITCLYHYWSISNYPVFS